MQKEEFVVQKKTGKERVYRRLYRYDRIKKNTVVLSDRYLGTFLGRLESGEPAWINNKRIAEVGIYEYIRTENPGLLVWLFSRIVGAKDAALWKNFLLQGQRLPATKVQLKEAVKFFISGVLREGRRIDIGVGVSEQIVLGEYDTPAEQHNPLRVSFIDFTKASNYQSTLDRLAKNTDPVIVLVQNTSLISALPGITISKYRYNPGIFIGCRGITVNMSAIQQLIFALRNIKSLSESLIGQLNSIGIVITQNTAEEWLIPGLNLLVCANLALLETLIGMGQKRLIEAPFVPLTKTLVKSSTARPIQATGNARSDFMSRIKDIIKSPTRQ